jgi:hypothetical protein
MLPKYKSHKEVEAVKIKEIVSTTTGYTIICEEDETGIKVDNEYVQKHNPQAGGYYVRYADGYESYSPAGPFEEGYTKIN